MNKRTYANFHGVVNVFLVGRASAPAVFRNGAGWNQQNAPSRTHLRNNDINCLCSAYNAATGAKIILTWNMQLNYPWMNLACATGWRHTVPHTNPSDWWLDGVRQSPLSTEQIQCHCLEKKIRVRAGQSCGQTRIWHLQTAARKRLQMCWGNSPVSAAEKKPPFLYFLPEKCAAHRTATLQTHDALTEYASLFPFKQ